MWDSNWFDNTNGAFPAYDAARLWQLESDNDATLKDASKSITEQAQKRKIANFAQVPVDCLEIETETKEA